MTLKHCKSGEIISEKERELFLDDLHRYLVWVGEKIPDQVKLDGKVLNLHELIWRFINKKKLSDKELEYIDKLIPLLEHKEKQDERLLETSPLICDEAEQIHDEAAGLIRAIMDLKDIEDRTIKDYKKFDTEEKRERDNKVEDARRWLNFLKQIK
ncbi:MAG: DUF5788 family protein [Methanosarcinales archaeon]